MYTGQCPRPGNRLGLFATNRPRGVAALVIEFSLPSPVRGPRSTASA